MNLPIEKSLPELKRALADHRCVVLEAPPGSGKSTIVPPALLEEPWLDGKKLILLQPRRVAARSIAARMAELRGEELGKTVGYRIRFESRVSAATRIEVLTEGILTRMIQEDGALDGVGAVFFDEFHERSTHADLALALALEIQETLRPDLRIVIMSATINAEVLRDFLPNCAVVRGEGVPYPVEIRYLPNDPSGRTADIAAAETNRALREDAGDVLVFLPGVGEIRQAGERLGATAGIELCELYGDLSYEEQRRALFPERSGKRKVILSTPIAETSLTIEGVRSVVDSGYAKVAKFDSSYGINRLVTERISQDSAEQRAGRAGRLGPGVCRRLWSEHTQRMLRKSRVPEILESDLSSLALELALWGAAEPTKLRFLDQPRESDWQQATQLLRQLGAIDDSGKITPKGRELVRIPAHPRLGALLLEAKDRKQLPLGCDIVSLLDERDLFRRDDRVGADLEERLHALRAMRRKQRNASVDFAQCARVDRTAREWARRFQTSVDSDDPARGDAGLLLSFAYPERIAKRRENAGKRYVLAAGAGATLGEHDRLAKSEFIVAAHLHTGAGDGKIFLASEIDRHVLEAAHSERMEKVKSLAWDDDRGCVVEKDETVLGAIVIESSSAVPNRERAEPMLIQKVLESGGVRCLEWSTEAEQFRNRAMLASFTFPEREIADLSDEALNDGLAQQLPMFLETAVRMSEVRAVPAMKYLEAILPWDQRKLLEKECPQSVTLPSGKVRSLRYEQPDALRPPTPVLSATVQELFGWKEAPKIAGGRILLTLEILSPARRPVQLTQDLRGFWERTYPDVRKELRGRYPKHPWPEDGLTAAPVLQRKRDG